MNRWIGIDPGPVTSGLVFCWAVGKAVGSDLPVPERATSTASRNDLRALLPPGRCIDDHVAIECVEARGQWIKGRGPALGDDLIDTIRTDALAGEWALVSCATVHLLYPRDIRIALTGTAKSTRPQVRRVVLDLYARHYPGGGGSEPAIGTKARPGPLYPLREVGSHAGDHHWSALYVLVAAWLAANRDSR